jgi:TRAP-type transport system periplasmic protein
MKKVYFLIGVITTFLFTITSFPPIAVAAEAFKPMTLKFAEAIPQISWFGKQRTWWANEVEKRTAGRIKIQIFWSESLVKWKDMLPGIQTGMADIGLTASTYHPSNFPLFLMLDNTFNLGDDPVASVLAEIETIEKEPSLKAEMERERVIMVCPQIGGASSLIGTRKCLGSIKDLKGKTIRTYGGARTQYYQYLGANPIFMPYSDLYEAIDRGTIDAIGDMGLIYSDTFKHYEVVKCVFAENLRAGLATGVMMNLDLFKKFPRDIQEVFLNLRTEYAVRTAQEIKEYEIGIAREWTTQRGVTIKYPSPEDQKIIAEAGQKANDFIIKKQESGGHMAARTVWEYFVKAKKKYEDQRAKKKG